ncbi:hypothetical protein B0H11DRAFT_2032000 [Mycena galericulata]|nr:hypothetical protein B0H11DRAFT_2032000 [Mycena galericulata]
MLSTLPMSPSPPSLNGLFYPPTSFKRTSPHNSLLGAVNLLLPVPLTVLSLLVWHALFCLISWWMLCLVSIGSRVYVIGMYSRASGQLSNVAAFLHALLLCKCYIDSVSLFNSKSYPCLAPMSRHPVASISKPSATSGDSPLGRAIPSAPAPSFSYHRTLLFRIVILMMHPSIIPLRTSMGPGRP